MRSLVLVLLVAAAAVEVLAAPQAPRTSSKDAYIVEQENDFNGVDPWKWSYRTSDGLERSEEGELDSSGSPDVTGSYTEVSAKTGVVYLVTYRADKHGFHVIKRPLGEQRPGEAERRLHNTAY